MIVSGDSCRAPLRPVQARHLDGRGDLFLVDQVVNVAEREEDVLQLPRLTEVLHLGQPRVEVSETRDELGGAHAEASSSQSATAGFTSCHRLASL